MDTQDPAASQQLALNPSIDNSAADDVTPASTETTHAAAEPVEDAAVKSPQAIETDTALSSARTQARLAPTAKPKAAGKPGARPRKQRSAEATAEPGAAVAVVLQTSRVNGADGRSIPRRTTVLTSAERAEALVERGWARPAGKEEARSATVILA